MVFIRFVGFILALLFVSFALQTLSVHGVQHQERRLLQGKSIKGTQENDASLKKASNKGFGLVQEYVAETNLGIDRRSHEVRIRGRKMTMILKEDGEIDARSRTTQKLNVEAGMNAFKKGPEGFLNNQGQETKLEKTIISASESSLKQDISSSNTSPSSFGTSKLFSDNHQSDEWRKLLEAADEKVMQMMRRDYGGMRRPRRKPPINNHEPRN